MNQQGAIHNKIAGTFEKTRKFQTQLLHYFPNSDNQNDYRIKAIVIITVERTTQMTKSITQQISMKTTTQITEYITIQMTIQMTIQVTTKSAHMV